MPQLTRFALLGCVALQLSLTACATSNHTPSSGTDVVAGHLDTKDACELLFPGAHCFDSWIVASGRDPITDAPNVRMIHLDSIDEDADTALQLAWRLENSVRTFVMIWGVGDAGTLTSDILEARIDDNTYHRFAGTKRAGDIALIGSADGHEFSAGFTRFVTELEQGHVLILRTQTSSGTIVRSYELEGFALARLNAEERYSGLEYGR